MIHVLKDWNGIRDSYWYLGERKLPMHQGLGKLWDFRNIAQTFGEPTDPQAPVIDLGCGMHIPGRRTMDLLFELGYRNFVGVDLAVPRSVELKSRLRKLLRADAPQFRLLRRDILKTGYPDGYFTGAICLSVIEHGLYQCPERFFAEVARLVRPGGLVYVSTDYWPDKQMPDGHLAGMPWRIFSRSELLELGAAASRCGLSSIDGALDEIEEPTERTVSYAGQRYTFAALALRRN